MSRLARYLIRIGLLAATISWLSWTMLQTVFEPSRAEAVADALYDQPAMKNWLVEQISAGIHATGAGGLGYSADEINEAARAAVDHPSVRPGIIDAFIDIHYVSLGMGDGYAPVIEPQAFIDAATASLQTQRPDITIPEDLLNLSPLWVPEDRVPDLSTARNFALNIQKPAAVAAVALIGVAAALAGFRWASLSVGRWMIGAGIGWVVLRTVVPVAARWFSEDFAASVDALTSAVAGKVVTAAVTMTVVGVVLVVAGDQKQRKHRRRIKAVEHATAQQQHADPLDRFNHPVAPNQPWNQRPYR